MNIFNFFKRKPQDKTVTSKDDLIFCGNKFETLTTQHNTTPQMVGKQDKLSEQIESVKERLASYFSQEIVDTAFREFNMYCRIEGLSITAETDFGRRTTIAQAQDEADLVFKMIKEIAKTCAQKYELIHRESNSSAWRYLRSKVVDGHWMYTENINYKYNAIEDTRKIWFEKHIGAMANIFSLQAVTSMISDYTSLMNGWFDDMHWSFNVDQMEFVEISSSRERDTDKQEHPQPNEILK